MRPLSVSAGLSSLEAAKKAANSLVISEDALQEYRYYAFASGVFSTLTLVFLVKIYRFAYKATPEVKVMQPVVVSSNCTCQAASRNQPQNLPQSRQQPQPQPCPCHGHSQFTQQTYPLRLPQPLQPTHALSAPPQPCQHAYAQPNSPPQAQHQCINRQ